MEFTFFFIEIKEMAGNQRATSVSEAIPEGHRLERNVLGGKGNVFQNRRDSESRMQELREPVCSTEMGGLLCKGPGAVQN